MVDLTWSDSSVLQYSQAHLPFSSCPAPSLALQRLRGVTVEGAPTDWPFRQQSEILANGLRNADHRRDRTREQDQISYES